MKQKKPRRLRGSATLGDGLGAHMKGKFLQLRDTLLGQSRIPVSSQETEVQRAVRQKRKRATPVRPAKANTATTSAHLTPVATPDQQAQRRSQAARSKPKVPQTPQESHESQKQEFEYWDFPGEAAVREAPPSFISYDDKSRFEQLIRAGAAASAARGEELIVVLGLDMGTSSTKLIVRLPYEPGGTTIAIPAPGPCRGDGSPYLWRTMLWLQDGGTFYPWPEPGATVLNSLKQGLIRERSATVISNIPASLTVSRAQAGVAYLSFVIRYAKSWLARNRPNLFRGRKPVWLVNLGMPAASYDDLTLAEPYRRIGTAALKLASSDSPVTVEATQVFLDDQRIVEAGTSSEIAEELGIVVIPETAAAMTGFAKSIRSAPDLYFMVDVGAMTLDACMFRLNQNIRTGDLYAFMAAQIRPLGVESFHWFLSEGKTESEFVQQCERTLRTVIWSTKGHRDRYAENWKPGNEVPVFFVGGGASNQLHMRRGDQDETAASTRVRRGSPGWNGGRA